MLAPRAPAHGAVGGVGAGADHHRGGRRLVPLLGGRHVLGDSGLSHAAALIWMMMIHSPSRVKQAGEKAV
jgi:hypothetical protein